MRHALAHRLMALVAMALVCETQVAASATPARSRFFAPAAPAKPARPLIPKAIGRGLRRANPFPAVRRGFGKTRVGFLRHIDERRLDRVKGEPQRSRLLQRRWGRDEARPAEAEALLARPILALSDRALDQPLVAEELRTSVDRLRGAVTSEGALLPVGMEAGHVDHLLRLALATVEGKQLYGAPEGIADVLENRVVAGRVVTGTLQGQVGWLTETQRAVLEEFQHVGNRAGAETFVHAAYRDAVEAALSTTRSYRVETLEPGAQLPLVIRAAIGRSPEIADKLRALREQGLAIRVRTMVHTPAGALRAAWEHAAFGEETELAWLNELVERGVRPNFRPTRMGMVRAVAFGRFSQRRPPSEADLERRIERVEDAIEQMVAIEVDGPAAADPAVRRTLAELNRALDPVRRQVAKHRLIFDLKHEAGESAREILPVVAAVALTAAGLQALGMPEGAIAAAEVGEDVGQGVATGATQGGQGRLLSESWRPSTILAAGVAVGGAFALVKVIHELATKGYGWAAGSLMGLGAVSLSGAVFGQGVALFKQGRLARLREGKVAGVVPVLMFDEDFQRALRGVQRRPPETRRARLLDLARGRLGELLAANRLSRAEVEDTLNALDSVAAYEDLRAMVVAPRQRALWRAAFAEALGTPMQRTLAQGMLVTLVASTLIGGLGFLDAGVTWQHVMPMLDWDSVGKGLAAIGAGGEAFYSLWRSRRMEPANERALTAALERMAAP